MGCWAVFDVDGTLLPGESMEMRFLKHAITRGMIPPGNVLRYFQMGVRRWLRGNWVDAFKANKVYAAGIQTSRLREASRGFFQARLLGALSRRGMETIRAYRISGYNILIMSGSPDFMVECLGEVFPDCRLIGTPMEMQDGRFTGNIAGLHPYGWRKREILLQRAEDWGMDFKASAVFANHHADVQHMELFGRAVAVNPTVRLGRIAAERGWPIELWRS